MRDNWHTLSQDPKDVDDLRQAILELAVEGKLTTQNPNDGSASEQLSRIQFQIKELIEKKVIRKIEPSS